MKYLLLAILLCGVSMAYACDICGAAVSTNDVGLLAQSKRHFIGVRGQYSSFRTVSGYTVGNHTTDRFYQIDLIGRFYLGTRFQLMGILPIRHNHRFSTYENTKLSGLGDAVILGNYTIFQSKKTEIIVTDTITKPKVKHHVLIGGGLKLPTGKYRRNADNDTHIPSNFSLSSGSFDFIIQAQYSLQYKNWGLNSLLYYKINTTNKQDYKFGNQFNSSIYTYYKIDFNNILLSPYFGLNTEVIGEDKEQGTTFYHPTGGKGLYTMLGMETYFPKWSLGLRYQQPMVQNYGQYELIAKARVSMNINFLF